MLRASIRELRSATKQIIDTVRRGEKVILTYRGEDYAEIAPLKRLRASVKQEEAFGMWADHEETKNVAKYVKQLRQGRKRYDDRH